MIELTGDQGHRVRVVAPHVASLSDIRDCWTEISFVGGGEVIVREGLAYVTARVEEELGCETRADTEATGVPAVHADLLSAIADEPVGDVRRRIIERAIKFARERLDREGT